MNENISDFAKAMMTRMTDAESGIRGRDPGPWRIVAEYLSALEFRVIALERRADISSTATKDKTE